MEAESAHDAGRGAIEFAADQARDCGQFVGHRFDARVQLVAMGIAAAAIVIGTAKPIPALSPEVE